MRNIFFYLNPFLRLKSKLKKNDLEIKRKKLKEKKRLDL